MLPGAGFIAWSDLRNMLRQRETLMWVFLMPIVFFYFIGTITGGYGRPGTGRPEPLVIEGPAGTDLLLDEIIRKLEAQNFRVERARANTTADSPSASGAARPPMRTLTVVPPANGKGFTEAVLAGEQQRFTYRSRVEGSAVQFERLRVSRAVYGVLADLAVVTSEQQSVSAAAFAQLAVAPRPVKLVVESAGRRRRAPTGFEQAIPGTMVMFTMLVSLTSGGIMLVLERRLGLLRRLAAAPIARSAVVAGKWLARVALAVVQIGFAMLTGTVLFGMDWGPSLPMVLVLLVAWAAFNASLALLLGSLARSEGQMVAVGVLSSMALGALGGCWWPVEISPRWMQSLALLLPTGWTMDAMHRLVSFGDSPLAALPHVAVLLTGTLVLAWTATRAFRYD